MTTTTETTNLVEQATTTPDQALELALQTKYLEDLQAALPQMVDSDGWIRGMIGLLKARPDVMKCSKASIVQAVFDAARTGIDPSSGGAEMFYFLPMGGEVSFALSYKGSIALAKRNGTLLDMYARSVREGDEWQWQQGGQEAIEHTPSLEPERETRPPPDLTSAGTPRSESRGEMPSALRLRNEIWPRSSGVATAGGRKMK